MDLECEKIISFGHLSLTSDVNISRQAMREYPITSGVEEENQSCSGWVELNNELLAQ